MRFRSATFHALTMILRESGLCLMVSMVAVERFGVAVVVGPFVPDAHAVFLQIVHVGVAAQKPQQLVDD